MTEDIIANSSVTLEGALTMRTVEAVRATLREAITGGEAIAGAPESNLSIDCSAATEFDLTFIQLLLATRLSARRLGFAVSLATAPDGAWLDTLTRGGFQIVREQEPDAFWFEGAGS
jgi:hypothetical protein